jgi:predicted transcriptional regulator
MRYRSRTDIVSTILDTVRRGATNTRIMYASYLSHLQTSEYLGLLLGKHLISYESDGRIYRLTERGARFLEAYERLKPTDAPGLDPRSPDPAIELHGQSVSRTKVIT